MPHPRDVAVLIDELVVHINDGQLVVAKRGEEPVEFRIHSGNLATIRIRRSLSSRENLHQYNPCIRSKFTDFPANGENALRDFSRRIRRGVVLVSRGGVVRPYVNHHDLGIRSFHLTMFKTPQDVLYAVPAKAEVQSRVLSEPPVEDPLGIATSIVRLPGMRDGVAYEHDLRVGRPCKFHSGIVALEPVVVVYFEPRERHVYGKWLTSFACRIAIGIVLAPALRQPLAAFHDIRGAI